MSTFEIVRGAEGDCLLLDDTRICGPKPWGGGTVTKTFHTDGAYAVVPKDELDRLKAESAELREELAKARDPQRIGGQADPSSFVYAIEQLREFHWQHATNDEDAIPYINNVAAAHERENAKLREDLEFERSENGWAREFLNRMGRKCGTKDCPSLVAYVAKLEAENVKMRELVDYMTPIAWYAASERERDRMRELGIEVE